jgi:hypothetical protein
MRKSEAEGALGKIGGGRVNPAACGYLPMSLECSCGRVRERSKKLHPTSRKFSCSAISRVGNCPCQVLSPRSRSKNTCPSHRRRGPLRRFPTKMRRFGRLRLDTAAGCTEMSRVRELFLNLEQCFRDSGSLSPLAQRPWFASISPEMCTFG